MAKQKTTDWWSSVLAPLDGLERATPVIGCRVLCTLTAARTTFALINLSFRHVLAVNYGQALLRSRLRKTKKADRSEDLSAFLAPLDGLEPTTP